MHAAQDDLVVWDHSLGAEDPEGRGPADMKVSRLDRRLAVRRGLPVRPRPGATPRPLTQCTVRPLLGGDSNRSGTDALVASAFLK